MKAVFTSEYLLISSLGGAFFTFFALNRGGIVVFIEASFIILLINMLAGVYRPSYLSTTYWVTLAIGAFILLSSVLFHSKISHYGWMANLTRMMCVIFALHCLSFKKLKYWVVVLICAIPAIAVCWQLIFFYYYKLPYGTYTNPHYLASFSMLVLPVLFGAFLIIKGWWRYFFLVIAILDANLLIMTGSRPAILGITSAISITLLFLVRGRIQWIGLTLLTVGLLSLYFSQYGELYSRFNQLFTQLGEEERVQLWLSALNALQDNSWLDWIVGNGIGGYRRVYLQYSAPQLSKYFFPHLHLLEILYENGFIGVFLIFGGFGALFTFAVRRFRRLTNHNLSISVKCLIVVLLSWMVHSGLTFPFYSKYSMYSLAFVLGPLLVFLEGGSVEIDQ